MHVVYDRFVKHVVVANERNQPSSTIIISISIGDACYFSYLGDILILVCHTDITGILVSDNDIDLLFSHEQTRSSIDPFFIHTLDVLLVFKAQLIRHSSCVLSTMQVHHGTGGSISTHDNRSVADCQQSEYDIYHTCFIHVSIISMYCWCED